MWKRTIDFEIGELLGEGSQGRVYRALRRDPATGLSQTVAVKILHSETTVASWKSEFESLAKVRSPYCVQVFGFERFKNRPALVLEFVDGVSLATLGKSCWLEEEDIVEILAQIESAVLDLYKFGSFHGDLSPQNILLDTAGQLRLLDFGLANCAAGLVRATPDFAAPERLCGEAASLAADIFSLGRIEQFLRGQKPSIDPQSPYLHALPHLRAMRGAFPDEKRRQKLGEKIRAFKERQELAQHRPTRTQLRIPQKQTASLLLALITGVLLMSVSSAEQSLPRPKSSTLQIRTHRWHYFRVNGSPLGYSPVKVPVEAGRPIHLEWTNAQGRGAREIELRPGGLYQLSDRDFSH